jgi:pimeloyl-ACP methyl ester carboxylesterase
MGAAAALLAAPQHPWVRGVIADSSFSSLHDLFCDVCEGLGIPKLLRPLTIWWVKREVMSASGLDCNRVAPIEAVRSTGVPLRLGHSLDDEIVPYAEAARILHEYAAPKEHVLFAGHHNSRPPRAWVDACLRFAASVFEMDEALFRTEPSEGSDGELPVLEELTAK